MNSGLRVMLLWAALLALQGCGSVPESPSTAAPRLTPKTWTALPGWRETSAEPALQAFRASCQVLAPEARWTSLCEQANQWNSAPAHDFFERWFSPHEVRDSANSSVGLLTGYFEPWLQASRVRTARFHVPVYGLPRDLLQIDLSAVYPELGRQRLRGRLVGRQVVPYHSRAEIERAHVLAGQEILWVDDAVALFVLQIQGSGKAILEDGTVVRLGYADQNGHPYKAIGKVLVERGELTLDAVSLQSIRAWLAAHPQEAAALMQSNPSYVFFELQPDSPGGPKGAQGVPLTPGHSVAVDARVISLGTPVYLAASSPLDGRALNRLAVAQDTGGAIRGAVRADLFLGAGTQAETLAGQLKQPLRVWVLLPKP